MKKVRLFSAAVLILCFMLSLVSCNGNNTATQSTSGTVATEEAKTAQTSSNSNSTKITKSTASTKTTTTARITKTTARTYQTHTHPWDTTNTTVSGSFAKSLKGFKLKVLYPWTPDAKGSVEEIKESALASQKAVAQKYGVTIIEDGKFASYNETLTAKLASNTVDYHVYMVQNYNFASYFKNEYFCDLTKAIKLTSVDLSDPWYVSSANAFLNINYKQYGWIAYDADYTFPYSIVYNKKLIKNAKLTEPATLAEQGKWTWDALINYAKTLTTSDIVGFSTTNKTMMLESMLQQSGTSLVNVSKGKQPSSNITNQKVKDALSTLYTWCKDDKICNTFRNQDWTYGKTQFAAGKVAMMHGSHDLVRTLSAKKVTDDFGIVQFPTKSGSKNYINVSDPNFVCFIPSMYKNDADKILFLRNELYRENFKYAQRYFTYQWNRYFDDDDVLEYACNIKYGRGDNKTVFSWQSICLKSEAKSNFTTVVDYVINNNGAIHEAIDKYNTSINKAFSDVWDGYKITGAV